MRSRRWSPRILIRYWLLQMPSILLVVGIVIVVHRHFDFPALYAWGIVILWVAKDAILYFFLWRAYDPRPQEPMVGLQGIAHEKIDPSGYVSVSGELWKAEVAQGFPAPEKGQAVEVLSVRGLTLTVRPLLQHPIKEDGSQ
jgi:membrane protein implicated in regulation of membrane protease activity